MDTVAGPSDVAVVEYRGVQPTAVVHGKSSAKTEPYVRTPATTMDHIGDTVSKATAKAVYDDCLLSMGAADALRNSRAVCDKKHQQSQKARRERQTQHHLNFADKYCRY